jgi:hypothetical protein
MNFQELMREVQKHLTPDLLKPTYRQLVLGGAHPMTGHCYVACEVMSFVAPDLKPHFVRHEGLPHWFLKCRRTGRVVDPTADQFKTIPLYNEGVGKGFLTKQPSKRAQVVLDRMKG